MIKLLVYNFIFFVIFSFISLIFVYEYFFASKLIANGNKMYDYFKSHPEYHLDLEKVGFITHNLPPTSFITNKPDFSKIRVGCFGDSHTEGIETALGNDYPTILQKLLGDKYQVINFGNGAYGSNQMFSLHNYYKNKYKLDYIILGPRGFYTSRNTSFNKYWNHGSLPYSQYFLNNGKLQERKPPGKDGYERIKKYYSFFSHKDLIDYDHVPPSFLKMAFLKFNSNIENPFYKKNIEEIQKVQRLQVKEIISSGTKVIHYTDSRVDCDNFKKIDHHNYQLYCAEKVINFFPNRAEISHPSAFGYHDHALEISKLIKKTKMRQTYIKFTENESFSKTKIRFNQYMQDTNLGVKIEDHTIACLKENKGYGSSLGNIINHNSSSIDITKYIFIVIYENRNNKSGGLFLKVPYEPSLINKLKEIDFESSSNINNVYFFGSDYITIEHIDNMIELEKESPEILSLFNILFSKNNHKKKTFYVPKFSSFKMTVKPDINSFTIMSNLKTKKSLIITMTNDCKSSKSSLEKK